MNLSMTSCSMRSSSVFPCIQVCLLYMFTSIISAASFRPTFFSFIHSIPSLSLSRRHRKGTELRMALESNNPHRNRFTQVVSDVDDTLKSSGGVNVGGVSLGGIDVQYERGDFYPGVGEFMVRGNTNRLNSDLSSLMIY